MPTDKPKIKRQYRSRSLYRRLALILLFVGLLFCFFPREELQFHGRTDDPIASKTSLRETIETIDLAGSVDYGLSRATGRIAVLMLQIPKSSLTSTADATDALHQESADSQNENLQAAYDYCIESHKRYCELHDYPFQLETSTYVGRLPYWQKIFTLIMLMTKALQDNSLDWIFWADSDTLILNHDIKLETFLPPSHVAWVANDTEVHVLMSRDHRGWNNGAFFIRVHTWSLAYLLRVYVYPDYNLDFDSLEQTAMARLYEEYADVRRHVVRVPMKWFNAYPSGRSLYVARDSDLQVHFPGGTNKDLMLQSIQNVLKGRHYRENVPYTGGGKIIPEDEHSPEEFWSHIIAGNISRGELYPHQ